MTWMYHIMWFMLPHINQAGGSDTMCDGCCARTIASVRWLLCTHQARPLALATSEHPPHSYTAGAHANPVFAGIAAFTPLTVWRGPHPPRPSLVFAVGSVPPLIASILIPVGGRPASSAAVLLLLPLLRSLGASPAAARPPGVIASVVTALLGFVLLGL